MPQVIEKIDNETYDKLLYNHSNEFLAKHKFYKREGKLFYYVPPFGIHRKPIQLQVIAPRDRNKILQQIFNESRIRLGRDTMYQKVQEQYANIPRIAVMNFLRTQESYQLHLIQPREKVVNPVRVTKICARWQMDHIDMKKFGWWNGGSKWVLVVIDTFSKYVWLRPETNKTFENVKNDFIDILSDNKAMGNKDPEILQSDNAKEFKALQPFLDERGIKHVLGPVYLPQAQGIVERFNRTLKNAIYSHFTKLDELFNNGTLTVPRLRQNYTYVLQQIADEYNNTVHTAIKDTPARIHKPNRKNVVQKKMREEVLDKWFKSSRHYDELKIGDCVRLHIKTDKDERKNSKFTKRYVPQWTHEIYTIQSIIGEQSAKIKPTYKLRDANGEILNAKYYRHDLQKIKLPKVFV